MPRGDGVVREVPPVEGVEGGVPPVDGVEGGVPPVEGVEGGVPPVDGVEGGVPPAEGIKGGVPPVEGVEGGLPPVEGVEGGVPPVDGVEGVGVVGSLPPEGLSTGTGGVTADEGFVVNRAPTGIVGLPPAGLSNPPPDGAPLATIGDAMGRDDGFPVNGLTVDGVRGMFDDRSTHVPTVSHPSSSVMTCVVAPSSDSRSQTGGK